QHGGGQHGGGQHGGGQHGQHAPGQQPPGQHPMSGYARVPGLTPTPPPQGPPGTQGPPPGYGATTYGTPYGGAPNYGEPGNSTAPLPSTPPPSSSPRRSAYLGASGVGGHTMVSPQPPDLSGTPGSAGPQSRRRTVLIVVAIVVAVLLIGLISYVVSVAASGDDNATSPRPTVSAPARSGVDLKSYSYSERGFTLKAPADWTAKEASTYVDYDSIDGDKLRVLVENGSSPEQHLKSAENYQQKRLEDGQISAFDTIHRKEAAKKLGGEETWEWEFVYTESGVQKHRLWRVAVVDGKAYSVYLTSPEKLFKDRVTLFDEITASFEFDTGAP
ncbi:PsbP-related protein, partial [Cryptosporangium minutisporangium]